MPGVKSNSYEGDYLMDRKHGWGYFEWESGNSYRGRYEADERHGFGEMRWTDGSIYRGSWLKCVQHGFGIMMFPIGDLKAGYFDQIVFKTSLKTLQEFDEWMRGQEQELTDSVPAEFRDELVEYLQDAEESSNNNNNNGTRLLNQPSSQEGTNRNLFKQAEKEDVNEKQAFKEANKGFNQTVYLPATISNSIE